ncbi:MAG: hypothetical protein GTO63_18640 [Anaerolineae bacterium]|nr:hypothetical protein [Anaerolineae bacterium]NIN96788.1 hypothetical protein [Anaerolineae bacterium]NIQ79784.1 hypothetical protein [Anaerolineae bacterium]
MRSEDASRQRNGEKVMVADLMVRQRPPTAQEFVFITLEDEVGDERDRAARCLPAVLRGSAEAGVVCAPFGRAISRPTALAHLVGDRVSSVPIGEIEWFQQVRNQSYDEGDAITVERDKVQAYLEHAELLMRSLFGTERGAPRYMGGLFDLAHRDDDDA